MSEIDGQTIVARALKQQGVDHMFGVVGIPIGGVARASQREGIAYYGMRHEMPATYAAQAVSYLGGHIAASLAVSGPGVLNAVGAFAHAWSNRWPMLLIGGAYETTGHGTGFFQEADQLTPLRPFAKYAARVEAIERIPFYIAEAVKKSLHGTPGPSYVELPGDMLPQKIDEARVEWEPRVSEPRRSLADPADVKAALAVLKSAKQPLIIIGKGIAYGRAEREIRALIEHTGIPYLAMPMAKGVLPDTHALSAAAARSFVLREADVIFLAAARLNWQLHLGKGARYRKDTRFIQLDRHAEEVGVNRPSDAMMVGDAKLALGQMLALLDREPWRLPEDSAWVAAVRAEADRNTKSIEPMLDDAAVPMGYYRALKAINEAMPHDMVIIAEGARTMDISRTVINNHLPRTRIDAGTFGSMGLGHGFAIGAAVQSPGRHVLCLQGDAAFGFGGTECEVAARYNLPITWVVFNNNGIGGHKAELFEQPMKPVGGMSPQARYDKMMEALGGRGYHATTPGELEVALAKALKHPGPSLINVVIDPASQARPQKFSWNQRG
jgi:2-hydroxyacyl-CoA lyase 1